MTAAHFSLAELAAAVGAELRGNPTHIIHAMNTLARASSNELAFLANPKYRGQLATTEAGAVLLRPEDVGDYPGNALVLTNPYLAFAILSQRFDRTPQPSPGIHSSAEVADSARIAADVSIGAQVVIGDGVTVGAGTIIEAGSVIHDRVVIGEQCRIRSRVVIYHDCRLGHRVQIHSGAVIGGDGFGFANERGHWRKIAQLGAVVIHDDVDIGANTTIDRGALEDTEIHTGVIIDNQVQIAHNVVIGAHTAIAACCGISGSTHIGAHCILAGGVGVVGHIHLCDHVHITGMTMVTKSITEPGSYSSGTAFDRTESWKKMAVRLRRLDEVVNRVQRLEKARDQDLSQRELA